MTISRKRTVFRSPHLGQGHDNSDQDIWITGICIWIDMT